MRAPYEYSSQARQILNDAEDDLRDWQPELEDVPSHAQLENNLMPSSASQHQGGSSAGDDTMIGHGQTGEADQSRISSGTSVTTGPAHTYAPSDVGTTSNSHVAA